MRIDWRGNPIVPGATIVYPGRHSSSLWMVEAKVIGWEERDHYGDTQVVLRVQPIRQGNGRSNYKPVTLTAFEKITVIPSCEKSVTEVMEESARMTV